jgi:hypothetical protein
MYMNELTITLRLVALLVVTGTLTAGVALADGKPSSEISTSRPTTRQNDQRLPPLLPGEEVVTQTGQRMRVWSSSGPVPVNPTPIPQPLPGTVGGAGLGVIVDGRDRFDHPVQPLRGAAGGARR